MILKNLFKVILILLIASTSYAQDVTPPTLVSAAQVSGNNFRIYFNETLAAKADQPWGTVAQITLRNFVGGQETGNNYYGGGGWTQSSNFVTVWLSSVPSNVCTKLTINVGLKDLAGNQSAAGEFVFVAWGTATCNPPADTTPPDLTSASGSIGSIVFNMDFNEALDPNFINSSQGTNYVIYQYSPNLLLGNASNSNFLTSNNTRLVTNLTSPISNNTWVIAKAIYGLRDVSGNIITIADSVKISFGTDPGPEPGVTDTTAPTISNATAHTSGFNKVLVNFTENVEITSSQNPAFYKVYPTASGEGADIGISDATRQASPNLNQVMLTTNTNMAYSTQHTVKATGVKDQSNNSTTTTYNFNSRAELDVTPPIISSVSQNNRTTLTIRFNESVAQASAENISNWSVFETATPSNTISVTSAGRQPTITDVRLTLGSQLAYSTQYSVRALNVQDLSGNNSNTTSNFVSSAQPTGYTVPVTIHNRENIVVKRMITAGVPYKQGQVSDLTTIGVQNPQGQTVGPVQAVRALSWGNNTTGDIRLAHVTFPVSVPANDSITYFVSTDVTQSATSPLSIVDTDGSPSVYTGDYVITTGRAKFYVSQDSFRIFDQILLDSDNNGSYDLDLLNWDQSLGIVTTDSTSSGNRESVSYRSTPDSVKILEQGPSKIIIGFYGRMTYNDTGLKHDNLAYRVYITFYAKSSTAKISARLFNRGPGPANVTTPSWFQLDVSSTSPQNEESIWIKSAAINLSSKITNGTITFDRDNIGTVYSTALSSGQRSKLFQDAYYWSNWQNFKNYHINASSGYVISTGNSGNEIAQITVTTSNAPGRMSLSGSSRNIGIAVLDFSENNPIGLSAKADGILSIDIWPSDMFRTYPLQGGIGKTHDTAINFSIPSQAVRDSARAYVEDFPVLCPPHWYATSNLTMWPFIPRDETTGKGTAFDNRNKAIEPHIGEGQQRGLLNPLWPTSMVNHRGGSLYNMLGKYDWGEFGAGFYSTWNNNEYGLDFGISLQLMRYGNRYPLWWDYLVTFERHWGDSDFHKCETPSWDVRGNNVGWYLQHRQPQHSYGPVFYTSNARGYLFGEEQHSPNMSAYAYYFTGEYGFKEDFLLYVEYLLRTIPPVQVPAGVSVSYSGTYPTQIGDDGATRAQAWWGEMGTEAFKIMLNQWYSDRVQRLFELIQGQNNLWLTSPHRDQIYTERSIPSIGLSNPYLNYLPFWETEALITAMVYYCQERAYSDIGSVPQWLKDSIAIYTDFTWNKMYITSYPTYGKGWNYINQNNSYVDADGLWQFGMTGSDAVLWANLAESTQISDPNNYNVNRTANIFNVAAASPNANPPGKSFNSKDSVMLTKMGVITEAWLADSRWISRNLASPIYTLPSPPPDTTPPTVISADETSATIIVVTFSENMGLTTTSNPANYDVGHTANWAVQATHIPVSSVAVSNNIATLTLQSAMTSSTNYRVDISNVQDIAGNVLTPNPTTATFDVGDYTAPQMTVASNPNLITIDVTWNETVTSPSATNISNWAVRDITASLDKTVLQAQLTSGTTVQLALSGSTQLVGNNFYQVTAVNVRDVAGNSCLSHNVFFTAEAPPPTDTTPPGVEGVTQTNDNTLVVTFNEELNEASAENLQNWSVNSQQPSGSVYNISASKGVVTLTMSSALPSEQTIPIIINNVQDTSGNATNNLTINFLTNDRTPPSILNYSVSSLTNIVVNFDDDMNATSAQNVSNYTLYISKFGPTNGLVSISNAVLSNNRTVILTTAQMWMETNLKCIVSTNVKDSSLNSLASPDTLDIVSFTPINTVKLEMPLNIRNVRRRGLIDIQFAFRGVLPTKPPFDNGITLPTKFSLETPLGISLYAGFIPITYVDPDSSVKTFRLLSNMDLKANSDTTLYLRFDTGTPNLPQINYITNRTEFQYNISIDNGLIGVFTKTNGLSPLKDLYIVKNDPLNRYAIVHRDSYYKIKVDGSEFTTESIPTTVTFNLSSLLCREIQNVVSTNKLQIISTSTFFAGLDHIRVSTKIKNIHNDFIILDDAELISNSTGAFNLVHYTDGLLSKTVKFNRGEATKIEVIQNSGGFNVYKNNVSISSGSNYNGWLGIEYPAGANNPDWTIGIFPNKIDQNNPRVLSASKGIVSDKFIANPIILSPNEEKEWITNIFLGRRRSFSASEFNAIFYNYSDPIILGPSNIYQQNTGIEDISDPYPERQINNP